jgi:hypothetical protein
MRLLHLALIGALMTVPMVMAGSNSADAARFCKCTSILPSGTCNGWGDCRELSESIGNFRSVRSTRDCRHSQVLACDYDSCKIVCDAKQK